MNKAAIKKFAVESRQKLIKSVIERLEELGITDKEVLELVEESGIYTVKSLTLNETEKKNRNIILSKIEEKGYEAFVEEVAYTWFNRIIAIRYMEVNDYLPFRTRVLSSEVQGKVDPDIITEIADHIEELELNRDKVIELKEQNKQEELFKYIFIKVCNYLGQFLPVMFEQIEDYTELLLPSVMISNGSVIKDMIELVPEEDWTNQIEIIGWLYQYYISEKKDQVFADLKKNKKITKENIPAATQLFTPEWIVKYMVENSLGRLWLEGHPNEELKSKWKYYLEEAEQEESVEIELTKLKKESEILTPEDLTIIDPAMGSGHILVYAFDVLYQIYQSEGYSEKEIPRLILEKNIHGLDIDDRAGQLACFALIMKARGYSRRFLKEIKNNEIQLNVCSIQESNGLNEEEISIFYRDNCLLKENLHCLIKVFKDSKEYGSILKVNRINLIDIENMLNNVDKQSIDIFQNHYLNIIRNRIYYLVKQYKIMTQKYRVLCTNPPYMGTRGMSNKLANYIREEYPFTKQDLFSVFMEMDRYIYDDGYSAMINQHSWMFLASFERFRKYFLEKKTIYNMLHLGTRAFEDIGGEVVQSTTFIVRNTYIQSYKGQYLRLINFNNANLKREKLLESKNKNVDYLYTVTIDRFKSIPGVPIAYWVSRDLINSFKYDLISNNCEIKQGLATCNNALFVRDWTEVNYSNIGFGIQDTVNSISSGKKWFPYNKGGGFRKWYGNNYTVVNWKDGGSDIHQYNNLPLNFNGAPVRAKKYYFREGITYGLISSTAFSARNIDGGFIFDVGGSMIFTDSIDKSYLLALLCTKVVKYILDVINPTLNYQVGDIGKLPIINNSYYLEEIKDISNKSILISKIDWDLFETSWDFKIHPLLKSIVIRGQYNLKELYKEWEYDCNVRFFQMKKNEEELNRIFIDIYGLQKELTPDVEDNDITIRKADRDRDIKSFISYAVGCMMGRYSLDEEGLVFAGGEFDINKYQTFKADEDGILLISDTEYFEDDLLNRFVEFVKVVYGEETLEENLNFIADTECFKRKATESSRDCLRRYFLKGFMDDHLKVYQKRPIYWMFDSGKQNGFKALIYLHRYNEDTVAKVRTDYLHPLQRKYEAELERLDQLINFESISASEKGKAKKRQEQIHKQLDECTQYDLLLAHVAHQRISLDLDDGVKVNYQKFQNIELTPDGSSKAKKGDLLYKVKM